MIKGKKTLVCGQADYVIHKHDDSCYALDDKGEKVLVCELPEIEEHNMMLLVMIMKSFYRAEKSRVKVIRTRMSAIKQRQS